METYQGNVVRIIFTNTQNTYCVFSFVDFYGTEMICVANMAAPNAGDTIEINGAYKTHKKYGKQFAVASFSRVKPETMGEAKVYLSQLGISGLGEKSLERILNHFGEGIVELLKAADPVEILDVKQVRQSVKEELYRTLVGEGALSHLDSFLTSHQISTKWSRELYDRYGTSAIAVLENNPYVLLRLPTPAVFGVADQLALALGMERNDPKRMEAAIYYMMDRLGDLGHTCIPIDEMLAYLDKPLEGFTDEVVAFLEAMIQRGELATTEWEGILYVYPHRLYRAEYDSVSFTQSLVQEEKNMPLDIDAFIQSFESDEHVQLGMEQQEAIKMALTHRMSTITGGPGTGKTTIIKALVKAFQKAGLENIVLCAPTGRASKRLMEATHHDATTVHRLLLPVPGSDAYDFAKNEEDPIDADVIIVDEASMLNVELYHALVAATPDNAIFIVVGDVNQLPPIGAGFVLRDLLASKVVPFTQLTAIYRQAEGNQIIANAYAINNGTMPELTECPEFSFIEVTQGPELMDQLVSVYTKELATTVDELDLQIICPMRKNETGSTAISKVIQERVHGLQQQGKDVPGVKINGQWFYVGDKVIQMVNDYELDLMNGEIGVIYMISKKSVAIRFVDKEVTMPVESLDQMMLAYAITVHKAQGSEYDTVILPFISAYGRMLQRNLLYTAITRAKKRVVIIGSKDALQRALDTVTGADRYTLFTERLTGSIDE